MTTNPPDDTAGEEAAEEAADEISEQEGDAADSSVAADTAAELAERIANLVGVDDWSADFGNAKVRVPYDSWVESITRVRDEGLEFFSFLSAIDWSSDVEVGEPLEEPVTERFEVIARLSSVENNDSVTISTDVAKEDPRLPSLVGVFGGANWHEREASEMFGIEFEGHPNPSKLYLPDAFEGFPLRKSFPLLSREVKPWPGLVDVEDMPSTENLEGEAVAASPDSDTDEQAVPQSDGPQDAESPAAGDSQEEAESEDEK